jgi:hypothetical protein
MSRFWPKIIGIVLIVGVVVVGVMAIKAMTSDAPQRTMREQWQLDDKRFRAEPKLKATPGANEPNQTIEPNTPIQADEPPQPQFRELDEIEMIDAERLFNVAVQHRKMGRMQGIGFNVMVECCRQIIARYPGSEYAFKAKRLLADMPERFRPRFNITEEEIDLGDYE